jgi:hypothetical protein
MKSLTIVSCFLVAACAMQAQTYAARSNFGARLEPQAGLMHGAGQDPTAFAAYWGVMPASRQPAVYMYYIGLRDLQANWADDAQGAAGRLSGRLHHSADRPEHDHRRDGPL